MTPTDRLAALLHEPCVEAWNQIRLSDPKRQVTQHGPDAHSVLATRLIAAGVTLAATPAPLDVLRARTALALALEETEGELRGTGSASWMAKVVWPVMEAHLAATPAPLDEQPLFDRIRELNAEVALLTKEAREDRAELRVALATPAPLDEKSPQCECERRCPVHGDGTITFATPALVATLGRIR